MPDSTSQVKVPPSCFVQKQRIFIFPIDKGVQFLAFVPFFWGKFLSFSHDVHLFVRHSSEWLKGIIKNFPDLFMSRLGVRSFLPTQAVRSLGRDGINNLCVDTRGIRVADPSLTFAPVNLLAKGEISKKYQDEWKCDDSHFSSLTPSRNASQWRDIAAFLTAQTQSRARPAHIAKLGAGRARPLAARFLALARRASLALPLGNHGEISRFDRTSIVPSFGL